MLRWMDIWIDGWMSWLLSFDDDYPIIDDGMDDSMMDDGMSVVALLLLYQDVVIKQSLCVCISSS